MKTPAHDRVAEIFEAHARALLLYARQWTDQAGAEDVVQRVFVRLLTGGRLPIEPRTWLFRCVRNEAISTARSSRRRQRRERSVSAGIPAWFVARTDDRIDARAAQDALGKLAPMQREIILLRIWSGLTLAETAQVTGLAISTVHGRYRDALAELRERLETPCTNPRA